MYFVESRRRTTVLTTKNIQSPPRAASSVTQTTSDAANSSTSTSSSTNGRTTDDVAAVTTSSKAATSLSAKGITPNDVDNTATTTTTTPSSSSSSKTKYDLSSFVARSDASDISSGALEAAILSQKRDREREKHGLQRVRELLSLIDAVMSVSSLWLSDKSKHHKSILALDFLDWHLRSFSQVVFINNSISGLAIMLSLIVGDWRQVKPMFGCLFHNVI